MANERRLNHDPMLEKRKAASTGSDVIVAARFPVHGVRDKQYSKKNEHDFMQCTPIECFRGTRSPRPDKGDQCPADHVIACTLF